MDNVSVKQDLLKEAIRLIMGLDESKLESALTEFLERRDTV